MQRSTHTVSHSSPLSTQVASEVAFAVPMENLNKKLKKLFSSKPKKFKGQGNVLGNRSEVRHCLLTCFQICLHHPVMRNNRAAFCRFA